MIVQAAVKLLIVDPVRRIVKRASLVPGETGYELYVDGKRIVLDAAQLAALEESCMPVQPSLLSALLRREERLCFGRVDDKYVPLLGRSTVVYIVIDLDATATTIVNPSERLGIDNEVIVVESSKLRTGTAWFSWQMLQKLYDYQVATIPTTPPARLMIAGLREREDQATGRVYLEVMSGLTQHHFMELLQGVKALEAMAYLEPDERARVVAKLGIPAALYRDLYEKTKELLEEVMKYAKQIGNEMMVKYVETKLQELNVMRNLALRTGLAIDVLVKGVKSEGE